MVLGGEDTLRRILFWRENVENDGEMNYNFRSGKMFFKIKVCDSVGIQVGAKLYI